VTFFLPDVHLAEEPAESPAVVPAMKLTTSRSACHGGFAIRCARACDAAGGGFVAGLLIIRLLDPIGFCRHPMHALVTCGEFSLGAIGVSLLAAWSRNVSADNRSGIQANHRSGYE
jgi:hypothetical protein